MNLFASLRCDGVGQEQVMADNTGKEYSSAVTQIGQSVINCLVQMGRILVSLLIYNGRTMCVLFIHFIVQAMQSNRFT